MVAPALGGLLTDLRRLAVGVRRRRRPGGADPRRRAWRPAGDGALRAARPGRQPARGFGPLLRSPAFMGYALQGAFSIAVFYAFLAAAPFLMLTVLHRPAERVRADVHHDLGRIYDRQLRRRALLRPRRRRSNDLAWAAWARSSDTLVTLALMLAGVWTPWAIFLPTSFGAFAQGVALPNTQAAFVSVHPQAAGTASGLGGFLQMGLAARGGADRGLDPGRHALSHGDRDEPVRRGRAHFGAGGDSLPSRPRRRTALTLAYLRRQCNKALAVPAPGLSPLWMLVFGLRLVRSGGSRRIRAQLRRGRCRLAVCHFGRCGIYRPVDRAIAPPEPVRHAVNRIERPTMAIGRPG